MKNIMYNRRKPNIICLTKIKKSQYLNNLEKNKVELQNNIEQEKIDFLCIKEKIFSRDYSIFNTVNKFNPIDQSQQNAINNSYDYQYYYPKKLEKNKIMDYKRNKPLVFNKIKNNNCPLINKNNDIINKSILTLIGNSIINPKKIY